jgi:outer membrane protein OmpA-like peptidoglycan-associated protein
MKNITLLFAAAMCLAVPTFAQEDAEGCKDSTILSRMPKCAIASCDKKDFDAADIRLGPNGDDGYKKQNVEGATEILTYQCDESISFLNIQRNAEAALKRAGFTILYSGAGDNEHPVVSARKGNVWVGVMTQQDALPQYVQTVVQAKAMEETMQASAEAFESEIAKTGSCSIYGILFDSGKATIQPASAQCLGEVAKLLNVNAAWRMQIEGHTDNLGAKAANATLSQQRADSVRTWLTGHGIAATRLTAKGFGDSKPIADNTTDEGRAKNRRVTLTKL